ncbi:MAG: hypothetical protein ACE5Q6_10425 [Dehalococcoidia bacterium]
MTNQSNVPLYSVIKDWLDARNMSFSTLLTSAGLSNPTGTAIKRGAKPREDTIRKLAQAMNLPLRQLLEAAGYAPADIERLVKELDLGLNQDEQGVLNRYRILGPESQRVITELMDVMLGHTPSRP